MKRMLSLLLFTLIAAGVSAQTPRAYSVEDFFKRGVARYQQGDLDGAFRDFDHALDSPTNSHPARRRRPITSASSTQPPPPFITTVASYVMTGAITTAR